MSDLVDIKVPDIGDFDSVDVVEVLVKPGDHVAVEDSLITLESDKASMEVPSPAAGVVESLEVKVGDKVGEGALIIRLRADAESSPAAETGEKPREDHRSEAPLQEAPDQKPPDQKAATKDAPSKTSRAAPAVPAASSGATREHGTKYDTDLLVLGSGPGGYTAAFRAADLGLSTVLVERYPHLGGVCLNVGCIPSKALLHAAKVIDEAADFAQHGIRFGEPKVDLDGLRSWKDSVVGKLTGGLAQLAKRRKVEVVQGVGTLTGPHEIVVQAGDGEGDDDGDGGRTITFGQAILAAGSQSIELPGMPHDDPRVMDSTGALELQDIPRRLLVIGGGIIGLEMATVYAALGSKVSVVELLDGLMPGCDRDLVRPLQRRIEKRYENVWLSTKVTEVKPRKDGLQAFFESQGSKSGPPQSAIFDRVLVAVGRRPNGGRIGAEAAGVEVDAKGFIAVDDQQRTNVAHLFAIGDLVPGPMLAHKASHEGKVAAEVAAGLKSGFEARVIPSVAYTDPEVAWVGLTETAAKEQGIAYQTGTFPWAASGRSLALGRDEGMTKLLFDPESQQLLGAGIVGPNAGDLIAEVGLAIEMGADAEDIGLTVHAHPTLSETVAFAAEAFSGTITDLYLPKKQKR